MIRGAFFSTSCASVRCESAERATRDSRRLSSTSRARPRDAPARSGQRSIRGGFLLPLARIRETRKRGAGNTRFAAAFFDPSCASARRASAEWATRDSRRLSSVLRAAPRNAKARNGQRANRGAFLQPLARVCETRKRGAGNVRFAALSFCPLRASARRASGRPQIPPASPYQPLARVRETRKCGAGNARFTALSSAPRARPRDAPARSGQRANRGGFLQHLARVCETRKRGTGSA